MKTLLALDDQDAPCWGTEKSVRLELVDGLLKNILLSVHSPEVATPQNAGLHAPLIELIRLMLQEPKVRAGWP